MQRPQIKSFSEKLKREEEIKNKKGIKFFYYILHIVEYFLKTSFSEPATATNHRQAL